MVNHWELLAPSAIGKLMIDGEEITNAIIGTDYW